LRRIYSIFYRILPVTRVDVDDRLYLLNEREAAAIRNRERIAIAISAIIGAMGVLLLYLPYYLAPAWFPVTTFTLFGHAFSLPLVFFAYSAILVWIEIILLTLLNIWCAHEIATATGFLNYENKAQDSRHNLLLDISLEKKNRNVLTYGIDPLQGMNKEALMAWNLLFILKATLTNFLFKFVIQRMLGRYAVKALQDFAGLPIFAFWNAYGTFTILREARVIIMGQNLIEELIRQLAARTNPNEADKLLLRDTMQYVAISKRDFHQNHYLLTQNLFEYYGIPHREVPWDEQAFRSHLEAASPESRSVCILLVVLGLLLDGQISIRERLKIRKLHASGLIPYGESEIIGFKNDFLDGKGVETLINNHLPPAVRTIH
jgi:hypothetical protein